VSDLTWFFDLYPDVNAQDADLGRALRRAGPEHDLADVVGARRLGGLDFTARLALEKRTARVFLDREQRGFVITLNGPQYRAAGRTPDLHAAADVLGRWYADADPDDLRDRHPFLMVGDRYRAEDAAAIVGIRWFDLIESHRASTRSADQRSCLTMAAAAGHPLLGRLFPFTSVFFLKFSRCTRWPYTMDLPSIVPTGVASFRVVAPGSPRYFSGELTLSDAIDEVVARLPGGCGPAIQGTADDVV
jgi:uncharacterized protein DUF6193